MHQNTVVLVTCQGMLKNVIEISHKCTANFLNARINKSAFRDDSCWFSNYPKKNEKNEGQRTPREKEVDGTEALSRSRAEVFRMCNTQLRSAPLRKKRKKEA